MISKIGVSLKSYDLTRALGPSLALLRSRDLARALGPSLVLLRLYDLTRALGHSLALLRLYDLARALEPSLNPCLDYITRFLTNPLYNNYSKELQHITR